MFKEVDGTPAFHGEPTTAQVLSAVDYLNGQPNRDELLELARIGLGMAVGRARESLADFYEFVMLEETTGKPLTLVPHQRLIMDFILAHPRCLIRGFAGCGKTYILAALGLFEMGLDPTERGVIGSFSQKQSRKPMAMIRQYIEGGGPLHLVFPELQKSQRGGDAWTLTQLTVARPRGIRDPSISAVHVGAALPGSRLSWFDGDDLITPDSVSTEDARDKTFDWLTGVVFSRMDADGGRVTISNTPYIPVDLTFQLEEGKGGMQPLPSLTLDAEGDVIIRNTDWDSDLIRPALTLDHKRERHRLVAHDTPAYARMVGIDTNASTWVDEKDEVPLWPERWGWPQLKREQAVTPVIEYLRSKRCIVTDPDKQRIKQEHINLCKRNAALHGVFSTVATWQGDDAFTGTDPAFGLKKQHDKSCVFTFALLPSGHRRILEIRVERMTTGALTDLIVDTAVRFHSVVCVEGNGAQVTVRDWAQSKRADVIVRARTTTHRRKVDPAFGVEQLLMEVQQGLWLFPHDPRTGLITDPGCLEFIKDLFAYRPGEHTGDTIMACWIAREQARSMGVLELVEEQAGPTLGSIGIR